MNHDEVVAGLISELRRGAIIISVLSLLKKPKYGYSIVKLLKENSIPIEASTLYPLMRRLEMQGLLTSKWDTGEAKPRKYYEITADGEIVLKKTKDYWKDFSNKLDILLGVDYE